ncbi:UNVERIFIED_CONTAM: hypothetical protein Sradi_2777300 [Sesamum radiatum]|uniref:Uncharacterized protein n=1 Tax=Sesamum radiatum TaxID=300843 RepID=A0AAW2S8W5_SESRA
MGCWTAGLFSVLGWTCRCNWASTGLLVGLHIAGLRAVSCAHTGFALMGREQWATQAGAVLVGLRLMCWTEPHGPILLGLRMLDRRPNIAAGGRDDFDSRAPMAATPRSEPDADAHQLISPIRHGKRLNMCKLTDVGAMTVSFMNALPTNEPWISSSKLYYLSAPI